MINLLASTSEIRKMGKLFAMIAMAIMIAMIGVSSPSLSDPAFAAATINGIIPEQSIEYKNPTSTFASLQIDYDYFLAAEDGPVSAFEGNANLAGSDPFLAIYGPDGPGITITDDYVSSQMDTQYAPNDSLSISDMGGAVVSEIARIFHGLVDNNSLETLGMLPDAHAQTAPTFKAIDASSPLDHGGRIWITIGDIINDDSGYKFASCTTTRDDITCTLTSSDRVLRIDHDRNSYVENQVRFSFIVAVTERPTSIGTYERTYNYDLSRGGTAPANQAPTFTNSTLPDISIPATGPLTDTPTLDAPNATDPDGTDPIVTHNASASYPVGTHTIRWTATDSGGLTATLDQNLIITHTNTFATVQNISPNNIFDEGGTFILRTSNLLSDPDVGDTHVFTACTVNHRADEVTCTVSNPPDGQLVFEHDGSDINAISEFSISVTFEERTLVGDVHSLTHGLNLRLNPVNDAPTFTESSLDDVTVQQNGTLTDIRPHLVVPEATDEEDGPIIPTHNADPAGYAVGNHTITWNATDSEGLFATLNQTVMVEAPDPEITYDGTLTDRNIEFTQPFPQTIIDLDDAFSTNVEGASITTSYTLSNGTLLTVGSRTDAVDILNTTALGTTRVTVNATDGTSDPFIHSFNINVVDTTAPTFDVDPLPGLSLEATGAQTDIRPLLTAPTATDTVDSSVTITSNAQTSYGVGIHDIVWTATDDSGNSATSTQRVTITDTTAPVFDSAVEPTQSIPFGQVYTIPTVTATDAVAGAVNVTTTITFDGGAVSSIDTTVPGVYTVTYTATDNFANTATETTIVTVNDNQPPTFDVSSLDDLVVNATGAQTNIIPSLLEVAPTATDPEDGAITPTHNATGTYPVGTYLITWNATDSGGLSATLNQNVTVSETAPPTFAESTLDDVTVEATGLLTDITPHLSAPQATDADGTALVPTHNAEASYGLGTHTITWTATGSGGATATLNQTVIVESRDGLLSPPDAAGVRVLTTTIGDPFTIGEGSQTLGLYGASRNFVVAGNSILQQPVFGPDDLDVDSSERLIFNVTTSVNLHYMFIDLDTNLGELQQTIDSTKQNHFQYNFTSLATPNGTTNIHLAIFDDDVYTSQGRIGAGTAVPLVENGDPQRQVTITDTTTAMFNSTLANKNIGYIIQFNNPVPLDAGNYPITFDFNTFESDRTPINFITRTFHVLVEPTFAESSLDDITVEATGPQTDVRPHLTAPQATNSTGGSIIPTNNTQASYPLGTHIITWTATDNYGLTATLPQNVIVEDTTAPTFDVDPLPEVTVEATGAQTDVRGSLTAPAVSDLVDPSPVVTNNTQASYPLGNHTITWTATDAEGNSRDANQNVIVQEPPADFTFASAEEDTLSVVAFTSHILLANGSSTAATGDLTSATVGSGATISLDFLPTTTTDARSLLIDLNTTLGVLHQTILPGSPGYVQFNY